MNRLQRLSSWFVPPELRESDSNEARTAVQLSKVLLTLLASIFFLELGDLLSLTYGADSLIVTVGGLVGIIALFLLRRGEVNTVRRMVLVTPLVLIALTATQAGGIEARNLFWLIIIPGLATWFKDAKSGKFWLLVTLGMVAGFVIAHAVGIEFASESLPPEKAFLDGTTMLIVLMVVTLVLAWLQDKVRLLALDQANQSLAQAQLAGQRLEESERRFRTFANAAKEAVIIHANGKIIDVNNAAEGILGASREDLVQRKAQLPLAPGCKLDRKAYLGREFEVQLHREGGGVFPAAVQVDKAKYGGQEVYMTVIQDLSKRKELEAKLVEAQKMQALGNLAGGVAHDFNNLLTIINGHAEISKSRSAGRVAEGLNAIMDASKRASGLINQLLLFSKREQHEPDIVAMNDVVAGMHKLFSRVIGSNIDLKVDLADNLWNIYADQSQMEQVILNLVVNARDAVSCNGEIRLSTSNFKRGEDEVICLQVEDNGCGIDEETRTRIFDPFFSTKGAGGTGLGLSTVYGIVHRCGGEILLESELDKGARFKVILPRCDEEVAKIEVSIDDAEHKGDATILLAEDDPDIREMVRMMLKDAGYSVVVVENGQIALDRLDSGMEFDLLITDIMMPEMDGLELASVLSRQKMGLPILFYSGYSTRDVPDSELQGAPVDFLKKPFGPQDMLDRVSRLLKVSVKDELAV